MQILFSLSLLLFSTFIACNRPKKPGEEWEAPGDADDLKNPVKNNLLAEQKGEIRLADLRKLLDPTVYPAPMHGFLIDLMRKFVSLVLQVW